MAAGLPKSAGGQPQVQFPTRPGQHEFILDEALLLTPQHKEEIELLAFTTLEETAVPIIVVTLSSLDQYGAGQLSIERYAKRLFDAWGIGHPKVQVGDKEISRNLGVLLLVAVENRKARIELGADWGHRKDAVCQEIMQDHIIASFKRGDFSGGIFTGVRALSAMVRDEPIPSPPRPWWQYALIIGFVGLGVFTIVSLIRRGASGWAWLFWGVVFSILGFILYRVLTSRSRGGGGFSGGSFGGGSSGGGGATGSW